MGRRTNTNLCLICESPKAICQFGALSCRACGAFFRRLVLSNRKYDCDCEARLRGKVETAMARKQRISKCRGCRMRRCYAAGMKEEIVRACQNSLAKMDNDSENQQIEIFAEDYKSKIFIKILLEIAEKANDIYLNVTGFSNSFLDKYASFEQLIQSKDNLLAHADFYKSRPIEYFDIAQFEENIIKHGLFYTEPIQFTKNLLVMINVAKAMPSFSRLNLNDQVASVSGFVSPASFIFGRFNSMNINADTEMMEIINYPYIRLYTKSTNSKEPIIKHLAEAIFDIPIKDYRKIAPNKEEMVLLLALLFTNSSIPSLSKFGQQIMNEESEKCAKILLQYQQSKFGEQRGALRYAECLQLLWNTISTAQKQKELIVYIDTFYEQGRLEAVMPKILTPLVI